MVEINNEKCIGCGKCAEDCIKLNIVLNGSKAQVKGECLQCGHCVAVCPAGAVSIPEYDMEDVEEYRPDLSFPGTEEILRSIKFRRSIRRYRKQPVARQDLELLVEAGRYTATAKNSQGSGFLIVQEELEHLKALVWDFIDQAQKEEHHQRNKQLLSYFVFNRRRKKNPEDDYLFRNAPVVLFITAENSVDAGMAAQNIENIAVSMGLGALYNGYLAGIADANAELKQWLGAEDKTIRICMLLGYPDIRYLRTVPRKKPFVVWK